MDYLFFILLTSFQGINSILSVNEISVKEGQSIAIPFYYYQEGHTYSKNNFYVYYYYYYYYWKRKTIVDRESRSERVSVSNDPTQGVFSVTITNLSRSDEGWYRCEIKAKRSDQYKNIYISVTGSPRLYVNHQYITGHEDGSVIINCYYSYYGEQKWCRIDGLCASLSSTNLDGMPVKMSDDFGKTPSVFSVTLRGLQMRHTGWYYCSVGDLQMPVHITVKQKRTTQKTTTQPPNNTTTTKTTSTVDNTSTRSITKKPLPSEGFNLTLLLGLLGVLLLLVICGILTVVRLKKHRSADGPEEATGTRKRHTGDMQNIEQDTEAMYSMIAMTNSMHEDNDTRYGDVTYSTVVAQNRGLRKSLRYQVEDVVYSEVATKKNTAVAH